MPWLTFHASLSLAHNIPPSIYTIGTTFKIHLEVNFLPPSQSYSGLSHHHCCLLHCSSLSHIFPYILFLTQHSGRPYKNRRHIVSFLCSKHCRGSQFPLEKKPKLLFSPLCFSNHVLYSFYCSCSNHLADPWVCQSHSNCTAFALAVSSARSTLLKIFLWPNPFPSLRLYLNFTF